VSSASYYLAIFVFLRIVGIKRIVVLLSIIIVLYSCSNDGALMPKRRGYFRIDLPEKNYTFYKGDCPFTFEHPGYSVVLKDRDTNSEPCWLNLVFPKFHGNLYLTYKALEGILPLFTEECRKFAVTHEIKASSINEQGVSNDSAHVYGLIYDIEGDAASNLEFYLTDSVHHFIRGALYFYAVPNKDSLAPVLGFIKQDIYHLIKTFRWE